MILLFLSVLLVSTNADYVISVYGDVHEDVEFFTRTFPWIIDNVGGEIVVNYYLVGSGRYSVPQMCALEELKLNTYLQAQYLKCEAEGNPSEYCVCDAGIDPKTFKQCVAAGGSLSSSATAKFSALSIDITPIIETDPGSTVYGVDGLSYLKKVCSIFGDNLPRGCIRPYNFVQSESFGEKKALAQFDRACLKEFPIRDDDDRPINPLPTTPYPYYTTPSTQSTTQEPSTSTPYPPYSTTPPPWWFTTEGTVGPPSLPYPPKPPPGWFTTEGTEGTVGTRSPPYLTTP